MEILKGGSQECLEIAVQNGATLNTKHYFHIQNLDSLQYIHQHQVPWKKQTSYDIYTECVYYTRMGLVDCIQYAHLNGSEWSSALCVDAARYSFECLKYAIDNGCPINNTDICKQALRYKQILDNGCPLDGTICEQAAMFGHLQCLHLAHKKGCPMTKNICTMSIFRDSAQCLKYAHQHGAKLTSRTLYLTARDKHQKCFKYLYQHQCPITKLTRKIAIRNQYLKIRKKSFDKEII